MKGIPAFSGIDIAKNIIAIHVEDKDGKVLTQKNLTRNKVITFYSNLPKCIIGIESCGGSQYWGRELSKLGHDVRLMNAKFIIPYRRKGKNDANDAEAICEAVNRPTMKYVAVKTKDQQSVLMVHRLRRQSISNRVAMGNQVHGYLLEFGISLRKGARNLSNDLHKIFESNVLPKLVVELLHELLASIAREEERTQYFDKHIRDWVAQNAEAKELVKLDGIGPLTASAVIATAGSPKAFKNGRQFAAWLGLVPKQYSSGGKPKLGSITKAGDRYLRTLLIHGSRTVILMANRDRGEHKEWIKALRERKHDNVVAVAYAAKQARMIWAILSGKTVQSI